MAKTFYFLTLKFMGIFLLYPPSVYEVGSLKDKTIWVITLQTVVDRQIDKVFCRTFDEPAPD